jgi:hypothetical protein
MFPHDPTITPLPQRAVVTKRDLENFFYQHGADVLDVHERPLHVTVSWYGGPSNAFAVDRLRDHTPAGVTFTLRNRGRVWAAWQLLTYAARILLRGTLRT